MREGSAAKTGPRNAGRRREVLNSLILKAPASWVTSGAFSVLSSGYVADSRDVAGGEVSRRQARDAAADARGGPGRGKRHHLAEVEPDATDESGSESPRRAATASEPNDERLEIIYEDPDVLVVNKPAGLLTSTVEREKRATLLAMVRHARPRDRIGLIHRLDRDAGGLLIFSKTERAYHSLKCSSFDTASIENTGRWSTERPSRLKGESSHA